MEIRNGHALIFVFMAILLSGQQAYFMWVGEIVNVRTKGKTLEVVLDDFENLEMPAYGSLLKHPENNNWYVTAQLLDEHPEKTSCQAIQGTNKYYYIWLEYCLCPSELWFLECKEGSLENDEQRINPALDPGLFCRAICENRPEKL